MDILSRPRLALILVACLAGCGIGDKLASSSGVCGGPPAEPGPDGCALVCRAAVPVRFINENPQIDVAINDRPMALVLDTGAGTSTITAASVATLGLGTPRAAPGQLFGIGGAQPRSVVDIADLALGHVRTGPRTLDVSEYGKSAASPAGGLGADVLSAYEVELDFPHSMLRLYEGKACPGPPPGWSTGGMVVPFGADFRGRQPVVPVTLDGLNLQAMIDSGASSSGVSIGFARRANVSEAELRSELATLSVGFGPNLGAGRMHQFHDLKIGRETLSDFEANVMELRLRGIDMLLGDDYLRERKVWISYGRHEVRITAEW